MLLKKVYQSKETCEYEVGEYGEFVVTRRRDTGDCYVTYVNPKFKKHVIVSFISDEENLHINVEHELTLLRNRANEALRDHTVSGEFGGLYAQDLVFIYSKSRDMFVEARCIHIVQANEVLGPERARYYKGLPPHEIERLAGLSTKHKRFIFETLEGEYAIIPEHTINRKIFIRSNQRDFERWKSYTIQGLLENEPADNRWSSDQVEGFLETEIGEDS